MAIDFQGGRVYIDTAVPEDEVRRVLKQHEPWRHKLDFSCGVSTADLQTFSPFNATPSRKIQLLERRIGALSVADARLAHVDLSGAELAGVDRADGLRGATLA